MYKKIDKLYTSYILGLQGICPKTCFRIRSTLHLGPNTFCMKPVWQGI
jgi:hypothetical protein